MSKPWFFVFFLCGAVFVESNSALSQESYADLPDSPSHDSRAVAQEDKPHSDREVSWKKLPRDFLEDQKSIWLFPAEPYVMPYFREHASGWDGFNDVFDPMITTAEVMAVPVSLLTAGYIRHDSYQVGTAILCAEAYGDSAIVDLAVKAITRRERPSDITTGDFHDTFFNSSKSPLKGSSFPSGHAAAAFSVATVVTVRYRNHRWVPWAAYGLATAIGFSRVTSSAHFPSDVFLGAAVGYTISSYQVLRPR